MAGPLTPPDRPSEPLGPREPFGWTRPQRLALGALLAALLTFLLLQILRRPSRLDDPLVLLHHQPLHLAATIDPNTASLEDLSRIPHLGQKLAANIVAYRDAHKPPNDTPLFLRPEDLDPVPGIGKSLLPQITPYLTFPDDPQDPPATTTSPSE